MLHHPPQVGPRVCATIPSYGGWHHLMIQLTVAVVSAGLFALLVFGSTRLARPHPRMGVAVTVIATLALSAIPLALIVSFVEERSLRPLIGHSWALTYDDPFAIPFLFGGLCVIAWRRSMRGMPFPNSPRLNTHRWLAISIVAAALYASGFHWMDAYAYDVFQFASDPKFEHDAAALLWLGAALVFLVPPAIANTFGRLRWSIIALTVVVIGLLIHEALFHLPPGVYHIPVDMNTWGGPIRCVLPFKAPLASQHFPVTDWIFILLWPVLIAICAWFWPKWRPGRNVQ